MATTTQFDMHRFCTRVQERRSALGWSQTTLATRAGVHLGNLNTIENEHKQSVRADTVVALAVALGVSTDYLLGLTDEVSHADA